MGAPIPFFCPAFPMARSKSFERTQPHTPTTQPARLPFGTHNPRNPPLPPRAKQEGLSLHRTPKAGVLP